MVLVAVKVRWSRLQLAMYVDWSQIISYWGVFGGIGQCEIVDEIPAFSFVKSMLYGINAPQLKSSVCYKQLLGAFGRYKSLIIMNILI